MKNYSQHVKKYSYNPIVLNSVFLVINQVLIIGSDRK